MPRKPRVPSIPDKPSIPSTTERTRAGPQAVGEPVMGAAQFDLWQAFAESWQAAEGDAAPAPPRKIRRRRS